MPLSIFSAARTAPHRIGLVTRTGSHTYAELAALTQIRAAALAASPDPVLLQPRLDLDGLLWIYAAAATGTPFVALSPSATPSERDAALTLSRAREPPRVGTRGTCAFVERVIDAERLFALMLTSGSTGTPKVVVLSRRAVLASAAASTANLGVHREEAWLLCLSLAHVAGLSIVVRMLATRGRVVLFEPGAAGLLERAPDLARCLREQSVSLVSLVPPVLERLLDAGFAPPARLRAVLLGGAGCSVPLARRAWRAGIPLVTSYGLTETGSQVVARRYVERWLPLPEREGHVSAGHPLVGAEIELRGGRIAIRAAALFSEYRGGTAPAVDGAGWFLTQDRGSIGPDGELYVLGRTDQVLVSGGENVDPEEIERALRALPEIEDACVFGVPCPEFGLRIAVVVVAARGARGIDLPWITHRLRATLARSKHPRALAVTDSLPRTGAGKLDRRACAERFGRACGLNCPAMFSTARIPSQRFD
jgi:acyl-CoA synthetase (AMP-forming)/AMP-acid ligase II